LWKAYPAHHTTYEAVALGHRLQDVDHAAAHKSEITGVQLDVHVDGPVQQAVEQARSAELQRGFAGACGTLAIDDYVIPLVHPRHHWPEQFGWILQVRIQHQYPMSPCHAQPSSQGELVAMIARKENNCETGLFLVKPPHGLSGPVGRPVIYKNDLKSVALVFFAGPHEPFSEFVEAFLFIEAGNNRG
jgi:hypothetical protein